ncbi:hypothetical protein F909_02611 [Acinetobacter sp. ANC 3929]|uniref:hypothetical protein n=1 Tax=unclassified Acinetobacter TaxID=196816 RepID=UPI0002D100DE|nr:MULTISPECIES: hypothetical protein [unclassified Acinetobacter]ENW81320.1 hypothetical protein F909_02611 [Acinetobacter sp. ANC 3929]MCH7354361.1 hypothetical protein [Acinetobacter sp. NIPH 1958]
MCDFELSEIIGLIQIAIGIIAIVLAILGYRKVLKQIDISNKQTNLTIAQVNSLNKERQADLKISLLSELNLQIKQLIEIKHNYEKLTIDLGNLLILLNTDPVKFANVISNMPIFEQIFERTKSERTIVVDNRLKGLEELYDDIYGNEVDVSTLEKTIQDTYKNNREIDGITVELNQILLAMEKLENSATQLR